MKRSEIKELTTSQVSIVNGGFGPGGAAFGAVTGAISGGMNGGFSGAIRGAAMGAIGGFFGGFAGALWKSGYKAASASMGANSVVFTVLSGTSTEGD